MNVTIVDYGVGNLRSLRRGLERADATVAVSDDPAELATAEAIVLPGVGAFEECMRNSEQFHDVLVEAAEDTPILGICVGLQLLYEESEEGAPEGETVEGLGLLPGRVRRIPAGDGVKVPHMGWNRLRIERNHPLVDGITEDDYAYFVHSYCTPAAETTVAACDYGFEFSAVAADDAGRVMGTQFHPEKSGETGLAILANFVDYARTYHQGDVAAD